MSQNPLSSDLRHVAQRFVRVLNSNPPPALADLSALHRSAVAFLDIQGGQTAGAFAQFEHVSPQAASVTFAHLIELKLVRASPDPRDARRKTLELTPHGKETAQSIRESKNNWLDQKLKTLTDEDLHTLKKAVSIMERIIDIP